MKITRITPWLVEVPSPYSYRGPTGELLFVQVETDGGVTGWGEVTTTYPVANRGTRAVLDQMDEFLGGEDPARIERIWHRVFRAFTYTGSRGMTTNVISGIDIALWDIRGKVLGLPVYELLLGGPVRESVALYTHPNPDIGPEEAAREAKEIIASGHRAIKFDPFPVMPEERHGYVGGGMSAAGEEQGVAITAAIREAAGPDAELMIDAHGRFDVPTAIRLARRVERYNLTWFEEPVAVESLHALRQVREQVSIPICVGERHYTRFEFAPLLEAEVTDFIMPDVTWTGGISELKKIATMAEAYYVPVAPHDASGPINVVAGAHVMMTVPNFYRLETARYRLSAYDAYIDHPLDVRGDQLCLSNRPGLGIEIDLDYLRAHEVPRSAR